MHIKEAQVANISVNIRLYGLNKEKSKDLELLGEKTSLIKKEIWVFHQLKEIFTFIFQTQ